MKSRLPNEPQPVPPIFQPEVGAEAVYRAVQPACLRREWYVGYPTYVAVIGDKAAPGLGDRYLARGGYEAQQTSEPVGPHRQDNLYEPVPGDHGAHGPFDSRSSESSPLLWFTTHRRWVALTCVAALVVAFGILVASVDNLRGSDAALAVLLSLSLLLGIASGWMIGRSRRCLMPNAFVATAVLAAGSLGGPVFTWSTFGPGPLSFAIAVLIAGLGAGLTFWPMREEQGAHQWL